jgi:pilus assembly protein CpaF
MSAVDVPDLNDLATQLRQRLIINEPQEGGYSADRIRAWVDEELGIVPEGLRTQLTELVLHQSFGLGPLEPLMRDAEVDEILVNGTEPVWVERGGQLQPTQISFSDEPQLRHVIERILSPLGRRVDESQPLVDARLQDGSRVNIVIPPLAIDGPVLSIRRFRRHGFSPDDLVTNETVTPDLLSFLRRAVAAKANVLVCGGTGSGKTTTLNVLSAFIGSNERVITIEDAAELTLRQPHVVRLEARGANLEGKGEVSIRDLVRNALRMRPDRIIVGEVRGGEALDMLTAMSTGHDGSLATVHAGSTEQAVRRLETLALMADVELPHAAVRAQVADAIDLIVCQRRCSDGTRRVTGISEVRNVAGVAVTNDIYYRDGDDEKWRASLSAELAHRFELAPHGE